MKKRVNITIDPKLHKDAVAYAKEVMSTDFSALVTTLLIEQRERERIRQNLSAPAESVLEEINRRTSAILGDRRGDALSSPLKSIADERRADLAAAERSRGGAVRRQATPSVGRGAKGRARP